MEGGMKMENNWFKRWELIISASMVVVVALVGIGGFLIDGYFAREEEKLAVKQQIEAEKEARKIRFWAEQFSLYQEATEAAATLATARNQDDLEAARAKFWALYWGKIAMVETNAVAKAMAEFGEKLAGIEERQEKGENPDLSILRGPSLELARCARKSLQSTWNPVKVSNIGKC